MSYPRLIPSETNLGTVDDYNAMIKNPAIPASYTILKDGDYYYALPLKSSLDKLKDTDAATVIQNAANVLTNGGKIFLKAGIHEISSSINVKSKISIIGEGREVTILKRTADIPIFKFYEYDGQSGNQEKNVLADLSLNGNYGQNYTSDMIQISQLKDSIFQRLSLYNYKGNGFYLKGSSSYKTFWCTFEDVLLEGYTNQNTGAGIYVDTYAHDCMFKRITGGYHKYGIYFNYGHHWLEDIWFVNCENMLYINGAKGIRGRALSFDTCRGHSLYIDASTKDVQHIHLHQLNFIVPPSNYALIYINVGSGKYVREVDLRDIFGYGTTQTYIVDKQGSGTLDRLTIDGVYHPSGTQGRYNNVSPKYIHNDPLFKTENSGTATLPSGQNSVTVAHGLAEEPTIITTCADHYQWYYSGGHVSSKDSTNITFALKSGQNAATDITIYWYAEYKP